MPKSLLKPLYDLFGNTLTDNEKTAKIVKVGFLHAAVHPVDYLSKAHTFVKTNEDTFILFVNFLIAEKLVDIGSYDIFTNVEKAAFKKLAVSGVEHMVDRLAVVLSVTNRNVKALVESFDGWVLFDNRLNVLGYDGFNNRGEILKVVVKGITVYPTVLNNVLDGYFTNGLLLQELKNRSLDCGFCKI